MTTHSQVQSQIVEAFNFRHAVKLFDAGRKISDSDFQTILEAARLSPTSFGLEPFQILVIQDLEKRELFRDFAWGANGALHGHEGQLGTASHFCIFLAHTSATMTPDSKYIENHLINVKEVPDEIRPGYMGAFKAFVETDFHLNSEELIHQWAARQTYIVLGNMLSAAAFLGIDSCPIEGFDLDKATKVLAEHFGVDTTKYRPAVMAAFGYRAADPHRGKTRRAMDQVVQWF